MLNKIPIHIKYYLNDYFGLNGETPLSYVEIGEKYEQKPVRVKMRMDKYLRKMKCSNHNLKEEFFLEN
jgi:hypothetical protein